MRELAELQKSHAHATGEPAKPTPHFNVTTAASAATTLARAKNQPRRQGRGTRLRGGRLGSSVPLPAEEK